MRDPLKGRIALRRGRVSNPGREYFLTVCTDRRRVGLTTSTVAGAIFDELRGMETDGIWLQRCAVVMPDHLHLLVVLGGRLSLGQAVARLKAKTKPVLQTANEELKWERDFFDRLLRPEEDRIAIFLYLFLNPYRAGLCQRNDHWPSYQCRNEDWEWFQNYLETDLPCPEWLA